MEYRRRKRSSIRLESWSSPEVDNYLETVNRPVIIPLGSFEQHGPHAPLGTDTLICWEICRHVAYKLKGVILPPVWYSVSAEHMDFAGTISIKPETFCNYVSDIILSLAEGGFTKILVLNGHGTNEAYFPLIEAKVRQRFPHPLNLLILSYWSALSPHEQEYLSSLKWGLHANAFETSLLMAVSPRFGQAVEHARHFPNIDGLNPNDIDAQLFRTLIKGSNGVWGDPEQASMEKGRALLSSIEATILNFICLKFDILIIG